MKKFLLSIFLPALFICHATWIARGQSASTTQPGATAEKTAALREADSLSVKAVRLYQAANYEEALTLAEQALKLREEAVGGEHRSVADAHKNLGAIYLARGKADNTRKHYARALSIYEKNPAANKTNILLLLDTLGLLERFAFSNYSAAIAHYERSLEFKQSSLGADHEDVIKTLYELAELYELTGNKSRAIEAHRRVIESREKREATHPNELILALNRFACFIDRLDMKAETAGVRQRVERLTAARAEQREREAAQQGGQKSGSEGIQGGVLNGKALSKPQPSYPEAAKRQRISGSVIVFVTVDETGRVIEAHSCGHPLLSESSLRAAYSARFSPTLLDGKPVKVRGQITYKFVLQ